MASGVSNALMASPLPHMKVAGAGGKVGTFGLNWLLQFNENVGVHTANANKTLEEFDATERAKLFGASSINALLDQLPRNFAVKGIGGKKFDKKSIKEIYERFSNADKQKFVQSMMVFAKKALGVSLREGITEGGQTAVSEISSATGLEGLTGEDLVGSISVGSLSGGFMAGPGGVVEARAANNQIKSDQAQLDSFNLGELSTAADEYSINVKDYEKQYQELVDSYEGPELETRIEALEKKDIKKDIIPERFEFERLKASPLSKGLNIVKDSLLNQSTDFLEAMRTNVKTGKDAYHLDRALRGYGPVQSGTGTTQTNSSFNTFKHNYVGEFLTPFGNIRDKWSNAYPFIGQFGSSIGKNIDKYMGQVLEKKVDPKLKSLVAKELGPKKMADLNKDITKIQGIQNKVYNTLAKELGKDGLTINFQKDYLTRGIDKKAVKSNPKGFLDALENLVGIGPTKDPDTGEIIETAKQVRERILNDILNDIDPATLTSEQIRKVNNRTGAGKPSFEKSRDGRWNRLPEEFRKKSPFESVGDYLLNASTRLASAKAFGANNANRLNEDINHLLGQDVISNPQAEKMWDMYDALHHVYKRPQDDTGRTRQLAYKTIATAAAVKYLGMATISSITEPAWIGQRVGFVNMLKATPTIAATALSGIKRSIWQGGVGKTPTTSFGRDLIRLMGFAVDPAMNERVEKLFAGDRNEFIGVYFRTPAGLFLTQYTNFVRTWTAVAGLKMIQGQAKKLKRLKGRARQRLIQELKENGMTIEDFETMYRAGGNKIDILNDEWLNTVITKSDGTQTRVRDLMVPWIRKITTDVALEPTATNRPLWMSNPDMQLLAQLKSFPILFGNTIARRVIRKINPKQCTPDFMGQMGTLAAVGAALGMAALALSIKDEIRGSERERGPIDLIGAVGVPLVGEESFTGYVGGPALGLADKFLSSLYGDGLAETLAETPEQFFDLILRATVGTLGAELVEDD